jgi:peptide/nickel transport system substrate-binding protein
MGKMKQWRSRLKHLRLLKYLRILGLCCLCCLLAISCTRSSPDRSRASNSNGRIVLGTTATISTIDPADTYSIFAGNLLYNLGDRLYTYTLNSTTLEPQLATSLPTVSQDRLTYTIPIRQGVLFHDGSPFDAAAMAFSLNRFIQNGGSPAFLLSDLVDTIQATGEYELTIKLKKPFAAFPSLLAFSGACAVSPKAYEIKEGSFKPQEFVGTGPYKLVRYGTDQLQLDTFEQYWGNQENNQPKNQLGNQSGEQKGNTIANAGIDIQFFSSSANLFNAFRTGAVDLAYQNLALDQIQTLQKDAASQGWRVIEKSGSGIDYLTLNLKSSPLDKLEVRQAIAAIMDRPLLQNRVFQGQIEPLYSLIPSTLEVQKPVFQAAYGDRNTEKAIALLTQAGYSPTNPLKVEFWYRSNVVNDQLAAITLKAIVRKHLGDWMQLDLKSIESTTAYKNLDKGVYPMFLLDWTPDFLDPDNYIQPFMECAKGSLQTGCEDGSSFLQGSFYFSDRANQLIDQSRQEVEPAKRKQLFAQLQDLLAQEVPFIPLWQNKDYLFAQKNLQGASLQITQKVPFRTLHRLSS